MKIVVIGGSGLIGKKVVKNLSEQGAIIYLTHYARERRVGHYDRDSGQVICGRPAFIHWSRSANRM
jgi:uncharacterized protein YbjT (DUF2867 family)